MSRRTRVAVPFPRPSRLLRLLRSVLVAALRTPTGHEVVFAGDPRRRRRAQEQHHRGDVVGCTGTAERDRAREVVELVLDTEHLPESLRDDRSWRDRVDSDAAFTELERQRLSEVDQPGLGGRVRTGVRRTARARARRDVDDRATGIHARGRRLAPLERRHEVELELGAKDLVGGVDEVMHVLLVRTTDVVDPDVDSAELGDRPVGELLREVADVVGGDECPPAARADALGGLPEIVDAASVDDDIAPGVRERQCNGTADALTGTGDDGDPVVETELVEDAHPARWNRIGRWVRPCRTNESLRTGSAASSMSVTRESNCSNATLASSRANGAPMQKWIPQPKATWPAASRWSRSSRNSSGSANLAGSRLAAA